MAKKSSKKGFQAPKGTCDILPEDQKYWEKIRKVLKDVASDYGYERIDTPMFEDTDLYLQGVGASTDVVEKQMYSFKTLGGDSVTLRPEYTAGVVRAYNEYGMFNVPQPVKFWYMGPVFRYEKPQEGRYRQFTQFGFETIGDQDPAYDAQIIKICINIFKGLGLKDVGVEINSIGCKNCRTTYRKEIVSYYKTRVQKMCKDCKRRYKENPLRLLDCKEEECVEYKASAPHAIDNLCDECKNHFKTVLDLLEELEVPYVLNHFLVRGLDYYSKTVFEFFPHVDEGSHRKSQSALGGGGRYDYLVQMLGGRNMPAVGAACGIERIISLMKKENVRVSQPPQINVFLAQLGGLSKKKAMKLFEELREAGINTAESFGKDSIKSQLKVADKIGARYSLILGQKEALDGNVILREMNSGSQETVPMEKIIKTLKNRL